MTETVSHSQTVAALPAETLADLKSLDDMPGLARLAFHLGALALTGSAVFWANTPWLLLAAMFVHGVVLVFLFTLEHEAIHGTAFKSQWINKTCAALAGFLLILPPAWFRCFHFAHHRHTQDRERDPELATPRPRNWKEYAVCLSGWTYWLGCIRALVRGARGIADDAFIPAPARLRVILEARIFVLAYAVAAAMAIAMPSAAILWYWVLPALLGQPLLRAFLLAEHGACPLVANMLANSRTTFTSRIVNLLAWNMSHHTAHHALPTVPFHRLPALTGLIKANIAVTARGYVEAHRQIRSAWPKQ